MQDKESKLIQAAEKEYPSDIYEPKSRAIFCSAIRSEVAWEFWDPVGFAEWCELKYSFVRSTNGGAWVSNEHDVYVNGSDFHYRELIRVYGKTTKELYTKFKKSQQNGK